MTCPCNVYPAFIYKYWGLKGYILYLFVLFLLQKLDCGYSIHNLCFEQKKKKKKKKKKQNKKKKNVFVMRFNRMGLKISLPLRKHCSVTVESRFLVIYVVCMCFSVVRR